MGKNERVASHKPVQDEWRRRKGILPEKTLAMAVNASYSPPQELSVTPADSVDSVNSSKMRL